MLSTAVVHAVCSVCACVWARTQGSQDMTVKPLSGFWHKPARGRNKNPVLRQCQRRKFKLLNGNLLPFLPHCIFRPLRGGGKREGDEA